MGSPIASLEGASQGICTGSYVFFDWAPSLGRNHQRPIVRCLNFLRKNTAEKKTLHDFKKKNGHPFTTPKRWLVLPTCVPGGFLRHQGTIDFLNPPVSVGEDPASRWRKFHHPKNQLRPSGLTLYSKVLGISKPIALRSHDSWGNPHFSDILLRGFPLDGKVPFGYVCVCVCHMTRTNKKNTHKFYGSLSKRHGLLGHFEWLEIRPTKKTPWGGVDLSG